MRYLNETLKKYLNDLASNKPAPGGGSASAVTAALGVSLLLMVANFTTGKKYEKVESTIKKIIRQLSNYKKKLELLTDKDIEVYKKVDSALKLPISPKRSTLLETALKNAAKVPLKICETSHLALKNVPLLLKKGNENLLTDVECGALFLKSAFAAAKINVDINLKYINDKKFARHIRRKLNQWQNY
ncbi:MAG: cyclodeaminase/cyclohydrolase family protein [Candidatus Omnitrophica bacterium]|nr:cyclodeaminase/cyclohydrolase family protein [Candidatus Omnitrophota bacterium]